MLRVTEGSNFCFVDLWGKVLQNSLGFLYTLDRLELEACVRSQSENHESARRANTMLVLDFGKFCEE